MFQAFDVVRHQTFMVFRFVLVFIPFVFWYACIWYMKRSFKQGKIRLNPDKTKPSSDHFRTPYYSPALRRTHLNSSG